MADDPIAKAKKHMEELKALNEGKSHAVDDGRRKTSEFGDGFSENFEPLKPLELKSCKSVSDLVSAMKSTAFGARSVGEAADLLFEMSQNKGMAVVGTFSGAMTIAKMGPVLCDMIDDGMLDAVISTGALMAHGFIEAAGMSHFKYRFEMKDEELFKKGYDRVYDTLELEENLDDTAEIVGGILSLIPQGSQVCSHTFCHSLGKYLSENTKGRGILKSAYECNVPVFIPAFTDSELGLDFGVHLRKMALEGKTPLIFNPFLDLERYTKIVLEAKELGLFTIGGGVPRNWAQQAAPYLEIIDERVGEGGGFRRFKYAIRICPEPVHWGGLSGCTYSEGVSWGKFIPPKEGGKFVEVYSDATIAWPLIVKAVQERLEIGKS